MCTTFTEELTKTPEDRRLYEQEGAIFQATETICARMNGVGMTRRDLATRMGKTAGWVTSFLDGRYRMDLRLLSDMAMALGCRVKISLEPIEEKP